ncbi:MAG: hypothetical protein E7241_05170 [Lachnospiraceae bacterium]|nr:hypothetical protein [Lachnospiraceae bacterium]
MQVMKGIGRLTNAKLQEHVGEFVIVTFFNGKVLSGRLGYTKEFSAKYQYKKPGYFTIGNCSFKVSHIKKIQVEAD